MTTANVNQMQVSAAGTGPGEYDVQVRGNDPAAAKAIVEELVRQMEGADPHPLDDLAQVEVETLAELAPVEVHVYPDAHYETDGQERDYRVFVHGEGAWEQGEYQSDSFRHALVTAKNNIVEMKPRHR